MKNTTPSTKGSNGNSKRKKEQRGRKFSVKSIKAGYKKAQDRANKKKFDKDTHAHSGIIDHVNTDLDVQLQKFPNITAKSKSYKKIDSPELVTKEDNDLLLNAEDWVDVVDPQSSTNYYEELVDVAGIESINILDSLVQGGASDEIFPVPQPNIAPGRQGPKIKSETLAEDISKRANVSKRKSKAGTKRKRGPNRASKRRNGARGSCRIKEEESVISRPTWTPFNTDITEWMRDIVSLNRLNAKRRKMRHVCDFLTTAGSVQSETLRRKKGELSDIIRSLKGTSSSFDKCFKELKRTIRNDGSNPALDQLMDALTKQRELNGELETCVQDFAIYAKSVENAHNLQESFILNLKSHSLELDKRVRECVMRFLTHVPSHRYTDEDHESRVLATSMFQQKEWTAGRYGRPPIGVTTKKTAHVTKFASILNMDIPDAHIPVFPD